MRNPTVTPAKAGAHNLTVTDCITVRDPGLRRDDEVAGRAATKKARIAPGLLYRNRPAIY